MFYPPCTRQKDLRAPPQLNTMQLVVDARETQLLEIIHKQTEVSVAQLALGDAVLIDAQDNVVMVIERKTLSDLASSISDGRYTEQSQRLLEMDIPNHNVVYVIEGDFNRYRQHGRINSDALRSCIVSLNYYKGFSVMRTTCIADTAAYLTGLLKKVTKGEREGRVPHLSGTETYSQCQSRTKSANTTPDTIAEQMLCQIPGINTTMARAILKERSFRELLDPTTCDLSGLTYTTEGGKSRRFPKPVLASLEQYLAVL